MLSRRTMFRLSASSVVAAMTVAVFPEFAHAEAEWPSQQREDNKGQVSQRGRNGYPKTYGKGYGRNYGKSTTKSCEC
ncbi:hypothetical protein GCM10027088_65280 [Nocardia goodfellowii]|uniref:Tat pathway signal protein n=1 Tax=Nocardia goodfellowii TaxID=882446 RepID=A0ABS4QRM0_9NOCA|nr:hypothetical protein [Nocardia goodfellowii]